MRMVVARVGRKSGGRPRWSSAYCRSSWLIGRKPAEASRWLSVSGKDAPIHAKLCWPVWLSKGSTRINLPEFSIDSALGLACAEACCMANSSAAKSQADLIRRRSRDRLGTDTSISGNDSKRRQSKRGIRDTRESKNRDPLFVAVSLPDNLAVQQRCNLGRIEILVIIEVLFIGRL